jgi:hypothetical protein
MNKRHFSNNHKYWRRNRSISATNSFSCANQIHDEKLALPEGQRRAMVTSSCLPKMPRRMNINKGQDEQLLGYRRITSSTHRRIEKTSPVILRNCTPL